MSILVIGSTGHIGTFLVQQLAGAGSEVRGLTRDPSKARFPAGVQPVFAQETADGWRAAAAQGTQYCLTLPNTA